MELLKYQKDIIAKSGIDTWIEISSKSDMTIFARERDEQKAIELINQLQKQQALNTAAFIQSVEKDQDKVEKTTDDEEKLDATRAASMKRIQDQQALDGPIQWHLKLRPDDENLTSEGFRHPPPTLERISLDCGLQADSVVIGKDKSVVTITVNRGEEAAAAQAADRIKLFYGNIKGCLIITRPPSTEEILKQSGMSDYVLKKDKTGKSILTVDERDSYAAEAAMLQLELHYPETAWKLVVTKEVVPDEIPADDPEKPKR